MHPPLVTFMPSIEEGDPTPYLDGRRALQYRMHPDISAFPARAFYQGRLKDAPGLEETCQAWHEHKVRCPPLWGPGLRVHGFRV